MDDQHTNVTGVSGRYASALFALAQDQHATEQVAADLDTFHAAMQGNPDLTRFVRSPVIGAQEQVRALGALLPALGIKGLAANFITLVGSKRRLFALADMIRDYAALNDAAKGVGRASVTVASPLGDAHLAMIKQQLRAITGKDVEVAVKVDPAIIGGIVVQIGSRMVDGSLKTKLNSIRTRMKEVG